MFGKRKPTITVRMLTPEELAQVSAEQAERPPYRRPEGYTGRARKRRLEFSDLEVREYECRNPITGAMTWESNTPADHPITRYFSDFDALKIAQREGRFEDAHRIAESNMSGFIEMMKQDIEDQGRVCISSSPHLFYLLEHLPYCEPPELAISNMDDLRRRMDDPTALAVWCAPMFAEAIERHRLWRRVRTHIAENPGVLQNAFGKTIGVDQKEVAKVLREAAERGLIRRVPEKKKTYRLFPS